MRFVLSVVSAMCVTYYMCGVGVCWAAVVARLLNKNNIDETGIAPVLEIC